MPNNKPTITIHVSGKDDHATAMLAAMICNMIEPFVSTATVDVKEFPKRKFDYNEAKDENILITKLYPSYD